MECFVTIPLSLFFFYLCRFVCKYVCLRVCIYQSRNSFHVTLVSVLLQLFRFLTSITSIERKVSRLCEDVSIFQPHTSFLFTHTYLNPTPVHSSPRSFVSLTHAPHTHLNRKESIQGVWVCVYLSASYILPFHTHVSQSSSSSFVSSPHAPHTLSPLNKRSKKHPG